MDAEWSDNLETLARGYDDEAATLKSHVDGAGAHAKAGNLAAAAESLESARRILVGLNHFRRFDNHIWVFVDIIRSIRRQSSDPKTPKPFQRLLDAIPSARMDQDMTRAQRIFWYGDADAPVGGQIGLVPSGGGAKQGCFIATAACGSPSSREVNSLRAFRDRSLLPSRPGRLAVAVYERLSPPLARIIEARAGLRGMVRRLLIAPLARALGVRANT